MANIFRVRALWQNWPGAPGYTNFYLDTAPLTTDLSAIRAFFNNIVGALPSGLSITIPSSGDVLEDTTGDLVAGWTQTPPAAVVGTNVAAYSGATGALVHWETGVVSNSRRVRGTTYLVPLVGIYDTVGTLSAANVTLIQGGATTMLGALAANLMVWSRPIPPTETGPPARAGSSHVANTASVPDKAVVLRSRRQ